MKHVIDKIIAKRVLVEINLIGVGCRCFEAVQSYLEDKDSESQLNIGADMRKIHECFRLLKVAA